MSTQQTVRRWILTGSITAIAATGAIYGAGLRSRQQYEEKRKKAVEATPEDMIAQLEVVRSELVGKKLEMERKLAQITARRLQKEEAAKDTK
ncbi:hypothetical protein K491DRAFT_593143 [Lophiostoma macrostomum CBS 122681]|uniref:Uncharacterized protein n=1 Tax=Lophiostoma macrostomum CBS 122681 TaxID=1314788 RepID=A0A6A6TG88_9PLEO|nr:hypothetical protein K491DRAFT_593143 [Lophiostoma macrostomum CBS 122681]